MDWNKLQTNLEARGFSVKIFDTGAEAADYLAKAIHGKTVGLDYYYVNLIIPVSLRDQGSGLRSGYCAGNRGF